MKVKIRGLVFAGFAAAVFAQSAMAVVPPSLMTSEDLPQGYTTVDDYTADVKKTVTSKKYTNETFQERLQGNATNSPDTALEEGGDGSVTEKAAFIGWNYGQGGENKEWVKLTGAVQAGDNTYVEIVHDTKSATKTHNVRLNPAAITGTANDILSADSDATNTVRKKLTTAEAVYGVLDRETDGTNGLGTTTISADSTDNKVPTSKNVYDFVNGKLDGMGANMKGNVTYHTQKVAVMKDSWVQIHPSDAPYVVTPTGDQLNNIDHWELIVPNARVASSAQNIIDGGTSGDTDVQTNLTTAKAVYDYAQPGATSAAGAQVGVKSGNTSTWYTLAAGQDGRNIGTNTQDTPYAQITRDNGEGTNTAGVYVDLNHSRVMLASDYTGSDFQKGIANVTDNIAGAGLALATAGAVKEYVDSITNGNNLPEMPGKCKVDGVHCALVTVPHAADATHDEAYATLEWTVMAQAQ